LGVLFMGINPCRTANFYLIYTNHLK
jgi:hypothetical protein